MEFWGSQFLSLLVGVAGSLIATVLWERRKRGPSIEAAWKPRFQSQDPAVSTQAFRECMMNAARWYLLGNIVWVVSGAAWALELGIIEGMIFSRVVLAATSVGAMFMFAMALWWVRLYIRCTKA